MNGKVVPFVFAGLIALGGGNMVYDHYHPVAVAETRPAIHASVSPQGSVVPSPVSSLPPRSASGAALKFRFHVRFHVPYLAHPHRILRIRRIFHPLRFFRYSFRL